MDVLSERDVLIGISNSSSSEDCLASLKLGGQNNRIKELERQLEIAESRCSTLKEQVEYIRMLYRGFTKMEINGSSRLNEFVGSFPAKKKGVRKVEHEKKADRALLGSEKRSKRKKAVERVATSLPAWRGGPQDHCHLSVARQEPRGTSTGKKKPTVDPQYGGKAKEDCDTKVKKKKCSAVAKGSPRRERVPSKGGRARRRGGGEGGTSDEGPEPASPGPRPRPPGRASKAEGGPHWRQPRPPRLGPSRVRVGYQRPTVASTLRSVLPYFQRCINFKTIPFVVGRSINKTHNLGLKIQETLSLIKMKNPQNRRTEYLEEDVMTEFTGLCHDEIPSSKKGVIDRGASGEGPLIDVRSETEPFDGLQQLSEDISDTDNRLRELTMDDVRVVLFNLHNEFSSLSERYDKLQSTERGVGDPPEREALGEQLARKECEMTTIMKLFQEVNSLKEKLDCVNKRSGNARSFNVSSTTTCTSTRYTWEGASYRSHGSYSFKLARLMRKIEQFQLKLTPSVF